MLYIMRVSFLQLVEDYEQNESVYVGNEHEKSKI